MEWMFICDTTKIEKLFRRAYLDMEPHTKGSYPPKSLIHMDWDPKPSPFEYVVHFHIHIHILSEPKVEKK